MIFQIFMVICILGVTLICDVIGVSYSNVYVEREVVPMGYYQYGTPYPLIANPRLSQINGLPSIQGYVAPCVSPCIYPAQTAASVTSVNSSPNVLTYNSPVPSVPIVVAPTKEEATPYEYSYVVYDENTGDHKAQRELSDGSVVRGEYSFLQPDGYVREVQYVADDISGFNAVVKNFLPVAVEGKRKAEGQEKKATSPPCHEIKNESLKEGSEEGLAEISKANEENSKEIHQKVSKESGKDSEEKSKQKQHIEPKNLKDESEEKSKETQTIKSKKISNEKESEEEPTQVYVSEESKEKSRTKSEEENKKISQKGSKEAFDENSGEKSVASHGKHKEAHDLLKPTDEVLVSYKDIIKCIEAAMKRNYRVPAAMRQGPSPLTYIVLNNPC